MLIKDLTIVLVVLLVLGWLGIIVHRLRIRKRLGAAAANKNLGEAKF